MNQGVAYKNRDQLLKLGFRRSTVEIYLYVDGLLTILDPNNPDHLQTRYTVTIEGYEKDLTCKKELK